MGNASQEALHVMLIIYTCCSITYVFILQLCPGGAYHNSA
jgi:hypothetical protein